MLHPNKFGQGVYIALQVNCNELSVYRFLSFRFTV